MELSPENIEELATAMSDNAAAIGTMDGAVFQNKSIFSNLDVDGVAANAQECLLNSSVEPIRSCSTSCSFNDILDDICEMNTTMELEQANLNTSNSQLQFPPIADLPMDSPAFFHMSDIGLQQEDYTPDCSFTNQTDFLQPLGQWSEYLSSPPSALDNMQEIPQLAPVPAPTSPPPPPPPPAPPAPPIQHTQAPQEAPPDLQAMNVNVNLDELQMVSSTPVMPLQLFNNFHFNFTPPMGHSHFMQHCENPKQYIPPVEENMNFLMVEGTGAVPPKKRPRIQKQASCFGWARVVPRKAFVQPTEVMILRPLRTRKVMSSRPNFDLSSYFDTSTITIPMIRERPRCKNANRRKQKLLTIPGADNLIFEVQLKPMDEEKEEQLDGENKFTDLNNNADQLYPETEIPELDEIFKRKRRGLSARRSQQPQDRVKTPSPNSTEEEKEVTAAPSPEDLTEIQESNSDIDSDDAPLTAMKSMKCQNCRKLFKTCRSLTIHSKRCDAIRQALAREKQDDTPQNRSIRRGSAQSNSSKENVDMRRDDDKLPYGLMSTARPLTRSQTIAAKRKAAGCHDEGGAAKKRC